MEVSTIISNHTAELVNEIAEKFYSDPLNVKAYEKWKLERKKKQIESEVNNGNNNN